MGGDSGLGDFNLLNEKLNETIKQFLLWAVGAAAIGGGFIVRQEWRQTKTEETVASHDTQIRDVLLTNTKIETKLASIETGILELKEALKK